MFQPASDAVVDIAQAIGSNASWNQAGSNHTTGTLKIGGSGSITDADVSLELANGKTITNNRK